LIICVRSSVSAIFLQCVFRICFPFYFCFFLLFRTFLAYNDPSVCIVLLRDLIFLWMIILPDSDGRTAFVLRLALPNIFSFLKDYAETF